jgi:hypothetical protein
MPVSPVSLIQIAFVVFFCFVAVLQFTREQNRSRSYTAIALGILLLPTLGSLILTCFVFVAGILASPVDAFQAARRIDQIEGFVSRHLLFRTPLATRMVISLLESAAQRGHCEAAFAKDRYLEWKYHPVSYGDRSVVEGESITSPSECDFEPRTTHSKYLGYEFFFGLAF